MKIEELRSLSSKDLYQRLRDLKGELFNLRLQAAQGHAIKSSSIREVKKDVACIKTLLREHELGISRGKGEGIEEK